MMFKQLFAADRCLESNLRVLVCVKAMIMIFIENVIKEIASLRKTNQSDRTVSHNCSRIWGNATRSWFSQLLNSQ